ncbi:hypothetical protein HPB49_010991 [Dermacentor silvarum]|uniref:Uncharacterized protein n=1 Tax=Dermacentor silvarum TaxID=543639 RepID=A0ACB8CWS3_DERSI|nr:hypothetical protein HPB49_010991 [Dermacentor silvarum]
MSRAIPSNAGRPSVTCCQSRGRESGKIQDESCTPMSAAQETSFGQEAFPFCRQVKSFTARTLGVVDNVAGQEYSKATEASQEEHSSPQHTAQPHGELGLDLIEKHLYYFRKTKNQLVIDRRQFTRISQVSAEECARQCWEATFDCKDFDFCFASGKQNMGVGTCTMYAHNDEPVKTTMSPVCSTYACTGNLSATPGGLSYFMILLGIGIGAAALFGYGFYRSHRANRV